MAVKIIKSDDNIEIDNICVVVLIVDLAAYGSVVVYVLELEFRYFRLEVFFIVAFESPYVP